MTLGSLWLLTIGFLVLLLFLAIRHDAKKQRRRRTLEAPVFRRGAHGGPNSNRRHRRRTFEEAFADGLQHPTRRGEPVRSWGEVRIANALHSWGLAYEYEPLIAGLYPDFYLPDYDVIIEYWGLKGDEGYDQNMRLKKAIYHQRGLAFINLDPDMGDALEAVLQRKLYRFTGPLRRKHGERPDGHHATH